MEFDIEMADVRPSIPSFIIVTTMAIVGIILLKIFVGLWGDKPIIRWIAPIIQSV